MRRDLCNSAAIEICNGAWCSGGIARYNSQQRLPALLARNPDAWADYMIEQMARMTGARRYSRLQAHQAHRQPRVEHRIRRGEQLPVGAIETARRGGRLPHPAHEAQATAASE
eukprot:7198500-Pyramimonas_sp.AAC.1